ncbi:MoaD/ThiS family protein [Aeoliella sp. SH292]|uniref:MoaD/ThiS family protein n=1 Tax=Aeoliella sp. SH292 TaxID=3454464 RepID=UPI003F9C73CE
MPKIVIAQHLTNQFAVPGECEAAGSTLAEVVHDLDRQYPGIRRYLLDDQGSLRQHVNLFIDNDWASDRRGLSDAVKPSSTIFVMQALSGG